MNSIFYTCILLNLQAKQQHEELKQKLLDEVEPQTLQQQENISIKGSSARHLVMQKLMRKAEVSFPFFILDKSIEAFDLHTNNSF